MFLIYYIVDNYIITVYINLRHKENKKILHIIVANKKKKRNNMSPTVMQRREKKNKD